MREMCWLCGREGLGVGGGGGVDMAREGESQFAIIYFFTPKLLKKVLFPSPFLFLNY